MDEKDQHERGLKLRIEMFGRDGQSIFGAIDQKVVKYDPPG